MTNNLAYESWLQTVPAEITSDLIWRTPAYRFSLYIHSCTQSNLQLIGSNRTTKAYADQLLRAVGGISANLDEGYSRSSGGERARFYEYALGSAREARGWYYKCAAALPPEVLSARLAVLSRIIRILTAIIPREREMGTTWRRKREQAN